MIIKYNRQVDIAAPSSATQDRSGVDRSGEILGDAAMRAGTVLAGVAGDWRRQQGEDLGRARHKADQDVLLEYTSKRAELDTTWRLKAKDYQGEKALNYADDYMASVTKFDTQFDKRLTSGDGQEWFKERSATMSRSTGGTITLAAHKAHEEHNAFLHLNAQTELTKQAAADPSRALDLIGQSSFIADTYAASQKLPPEEAKAYRKAQAGNVAAIALDSAMAQENGAVAEAILNSTVTYNAVNGPEQIPVKDLLGAERSIAATKRVADYTDNARIHGVAREAATFDNPDEALKFIDGNPNLRNAAEKSKAERHVYELQNARRAQQAANDTQYFTILDEIMTGQANGVVETPAILDQKQQALSKLSNAGKARYAHAERLSAQRKGAADAKAMEASQAADAAARVELAISSGLVTGGDGKPVHLSNLPPDTQAEVLNSLTMGVAAKDREEVRKRITRALKGDPDKLHDATVKAVQHFKGFEKPDQVFADPSAALLAANVKLRLGKMALPGNATDETVRDAVVIAEAEAAKELPYAAMNPAAKAEADAIWEEEKKKKPGLKEDVNHTLRYRYWLLVNQPAYFARSYDADNVAAGLTMESDATMRAVIPDVPGAPAELGGWAQGIADASVQRWLAQPASPTSAPTEAAAAPAPAGAPSVWEQMVWTKSDYAAYRAANPDAGMFLGPKGTAATAQEHQALRTIGPSGGAATLADAVQDIPANVVQDVNAASYAVDQVALRMDAGWRGIVEGAATQLQEAASDGAETLALAMAQMSEDVRAEAVETMLRRVREEALADARLHQQLIGSVRLPLRGVPHVPPYAVPAPAGVTGTRAATAAPKDNYGRYSNPFATSAE